MRFVRYLSVTLFLVSAGLAWAGGSLKDDIKAGCARNFAINREEQAVIFLPDENNPGGHAFMLKGAPAQRWIDLANTERMLGGAFLQRPVVELKKDGNGNLAASVIRFDLGCMFVSDKRIAVLDWRAVQAWEKGGGYNKLGIPKRDDFKARVKIVPSKT